MQVQLQVTLAGIFTLRKRSFNELSTWKWSLLAEVRFVNQNSLSEKIKKCKSKKLKTRRALEMVQNLKWRNSLRNNRINNLHCSSSLQPKFVTATKTNLGSTKIHELQVQYEIAKVKYDQKVRVFWLLKTRCSVRKTKAMIFLQAVRVGKLEKY